jgi:hypothetical protein
MIVERTMPTSDKNVTLRNVLKPDPAREKFLFLPPRMHIKDAFDLTDREVLTDVHNIPGDFLRFP